jgi:hypothetical protein
MKHQKKTRQPGERLVSLTRDELTFALSIAGAAATYAMPMKSPSQSRVHIAGRTMRFTDTPGNRMLFAVRDAFEDRAKGLSANVRLERLMCAFEDPALAAWFWRQDGHVEIRDALLDEIASEPLELGVRCFELTDLATRVAARFAAGGYEDERWPPASQG